MRAIMLVVLVGCMGASKKSAMAPAYAPAASRVAGTSSSEPDAPQRKVTSWQDISVVAQAESPEPQDITNDGTLHSGTSTGATGAATAPTAEAPPAKDLEKLVVEAWVEMSTSNVAKTVDMIRTRVEHSGGRIVSENVNGSESSASSASLEFRIPPAQATAVATWLGTLGTITHKRVQATEVSKTLFDQELALKNLEVTMSRLQVLAEKGGPIDQVLAIEKEMTRVRGEIERIKGEQRFLLDRVAYATISVGIAREGDGDPDDLVPEARIYPGPQLSTLTLIDPGMRQRTRAGAGVSVQIRRYATFELSVFPRGDGGDSRAVLATVGTGLYSGYLGYGQRRYFNPYIGVRAGFGYLSGSSSPVFAGEVGVELFKHEYVLIDTSLRALAFTKSSAEAALQATLGLAVPF